MSDRRADVIVVGGGVVGAACAYYLAESGRSVCVVDAGRFGAGCSHGNCGLVCPSHVLPLATPGAISKVARAMLCGNAPLAVRPGWNGSLWAWLWNFARRCRSDLMLQSARAQHALLQSSRQLYGELIRQPGFDCEWQDRGLLFVYNAPREFDAYAATEQLVRSEFGVAGTRIDGPELPRFEPALKSGLAGGWHYAGDAHLRPDKLMASWRRLLEARGVAIVEQVEVEAFDAAGGSINALATSAGRMTAGAYVLATGALAPRLGRDLGLKLPIQPGKGYSLTMPRPAITPGVPMILEEYHVGVTPFATGYRLGSTMELAGYDATINRRRLALLTRGAEQCLRTPTCEPIQEEWYGWRPMTYDGLPCIGPAPGTANAFVAVGHGMLGVSTSPATGRLLAELATGREAHLDPRPYSVLRF
jgi:D-amino-acid dehydrogenase